MVSRENQGLQAALVIFVVLTVVAGVVAVACFNKWDDVQTRLAHAETALQLAEGIAESRALELRELKLMLGAKAEDSLTQIGTQRDADFAKLPGNAQKLTYRDLAHQLAGVLAQMEGHVIAGVERAVKLEDKIDTDELSKQSEIKEYDRANDLAATAYAEERSRLQKDVDKAAAAKLAALEFFKKRQNEYDSDVLALKSYTQDLEKDVKQLQGVNKNLFARIQGDEATREIFDGAVTGVSQREQLVWLNRGSADGLRSMVTFTVIDHGVPGPVGAESKATIEVVRVSGPHAAEARILSDEPTNPVLPGDNLFSAVWHPGRTEHFALSGFMDIDGDGESDRDLVRQLIQRSGGVIDAELSDDGQLTGELAVDTRYLIEGRVPDARSSDTLLKNHGKLRAQADFQCVHVLSIGKFLDYVGYRQTVRTVALNGGEKPSAFGRGAPRVNLQSPVNFDPVRPKTKPSTY